MLRPPGSIITLAAVAPLGCLIGAFAAGPALAAPAGAAPPLAAATQNADVPDAPEVDDASYRDLIADAQRLLALRGFDPGPIDGRVGLRTREAIRAYQAVARSEGVLEAVKGPPPDGRDLVDLPGRSPGLIRLEPPAAAASD